jgi:hypothetical protein
MSKTVCMSDDCEHPDLNPGDKVVQVGTGTLMVRYVTPANREIEGEWHLDCFSEFTLTPQALPYKCNRCKKPIKNRSKVSYALVGTNPDEIYVTVELRGTVQWIAHDGPCPT